MDCPRRCQIKVISSLNPDNKTMSSDYRRNDTITVKCGPVSGSVSVPASKSVVHRLLICAALAEMPCTVSAQNISKDIDATISCLNSMGAEIVKSCSDEKIESMNGSVQVCITVNKGVTRGGECDAYCGESGSTLRFLIPVACALGKDVRFHMEGKLPERPHSVLTDELRKHGATVSQKGSILEIGGMLSAGTFRIAGNVSSQFISGLLFALPLLDGDSKIVITGKRESESYIGMTLDAVISSGIEVRTTSDGFLVGGGQSYAVKEFCEAERDWSGAAFLFCMGAMSEKGITVCGMNSASHQGDRKIIDLIKEFGCEVIYNGSDITVKKGKCRPLDVDASDIPDLVPVLSILFCAAKGRSVIRNAQRLRFKESDRLASTSAMIRSLGGEAEVTEDGLVIYGTGSLVGGKVDTFNDHRIAMSAATAAGICRSDVIIPGASCADKSYPGFFNVLNNLQKEA